MIRFRSCCPKLRPSSAAGMTKSGVHDGKEMWLIYAADGTKIAATDDRDFAFVMAKQNDLCPKSVH